MTDRPRKELVLRTYERKGGGVPAGKYVTRRHNLAGDPFAVFCTNVDCPHYLDAEAALPFWSEDCPEVLGILRCLECGAPVVRPPGNPDGAEGRD